ncbi:alpha/beta hydrolase [Nocardiopsis flavescens]|uniref:Alpha/beta hydrolase n=1 Tax=Nocardiopsis flavescens TaxID=758803 RepID=A0A1M6MRD2_9ACTN|nr:alpha/beta hydrolase [Nocardiopsis flavescens]SHJ85940.1 Alpha/beta hydrolase [Nocardiopsis flavescens]
MITAGPRTAPPPAPLHYRDQEWNGIRLLAYDDTGDGRIVEALGDVATADHIVVLVPGNDNYLGNYFDPSRPTRPRVNGATLLRTMGTIARGERFAVVVWMGYDTPRGFVEGAFRGPARQAAPDLVRLTRFLPGNAHITLVGHSYGTVVCGLALAQARVDDCIVLGSPGMGGSSTADLRYSGNLWAAQGREDWIRFFPRGRAGDLGHGPTPLRPGFGALRIETGEIPGHCAYYTDGSESVRNMARIGLGRYEEVTLVDPLVRAPLPRPVVAVRERAGTTVPAPGERIAP